MRTEYEYPELADRLPPNQWQEMGSQDIRTQAGGRVKQILSTHYPDYISPEIDAKLRERFTIELDQAVMRPGTCGPETVVGNHL
jgi:trimethylamine--corrinoid protein Co-methyltransferase